MGIFLLVARSASALQLVCGLRNLATLMAGSREREGPTDAVTIPRMIKVLSEGIDLAWRLLLFCQSAIYAYAPLAAGRPQLSNPQALTNCARSAWQWHLRQGTPSGGHCRAYP
jgi:hypothetical protein